MMVELFWLGILLLLYTYFIYPILLYVVGRRIDSEVSEPSFWPAVDVLLSAYNEEICIKERIENLLSSNYQGKLRILVANDGSSDKTGEIIDSFQDERVVAYNFSENRGKVAVLNELVSKANAGIIVFTDARYR
jgi:glycosyltransferase involved in cell wall biosynthesis